MKPTWSRAAAPALLVSMWACESGRKPMQGLDPGPVPAELADGERIYDANCRTCHGPLGTGTEAGPPLVHRIYEPSHHSDAAFQLAVTRGVRAHHWSFGNMAPLPTVDSAEVSRAIAYVRWLQRQAGIQ